MWVKIVQFLLCLSILIVLHECGHFFTAKWFKTRVEKFYLFFNPWFSLFKVQKGETEYGIGWLPLGGYVKISGMIDESFDKEQMAGPPQPWEFRSKPAWQRLIIMLGGVIVNFILGVLIFSFLLYGYGESHIKNDSLKYGVFVDGLGSELGLKDGDLPIKVGNTEIKKFPSSAFKRDIAINGARTITVMRDGQEKVLTLTDEQAGKLTQHENKDSIIYYARMPYVIKVVNPETFAEKAGIKPNDQLIGVNGKSGTYFHELSKMIKSYKGEDYTLDVLRGADTIQLNIKLDENKIMGVNAYPADHYFKSETTKYSLLASFPAGWKKSIDFLSFQIKAFGEMFKGKIKAKDSLGSLITIGSMFSSTWDWYVFWNMTASLSLLLGFLNLLPIPALDGGHVMFLLFEAITGVKPSDTVIEYATLAGFILLSILMVYALGLDISRLF